jgi:WhiB family redox-sensing transcriptional regulator
MNWRHRAACADKDPELFYPVGENGPALAQIAQAKAVCHSCPVRAECLRWALDHGEEGVWGATSEDDRRALRLWEIRHARVA